MDTNTDGATSVSEVIREQDPIGQQIKSNGHRKTLCETRQQPALLRAAVRFSTKIEKWNKAFSTKLEKWDKGFSAAVYRVACEASEALQIHDELVEYHGGKDRGAFMYVLALSNLEQSPDARMECALRRTIQLYNDELEAWRLNKLISQHRRRVARTGYVERVERIYKKFRRYASHNQALATLSKYHRENADTVLRDTIRETVCSEGAHLLLDEDILNEVGNRIRREGTHKRKKLEAEERLRLEDAKLVGSSKQGVRGPTDSRNLEQVSFDALDHLEQLNKKASKSRTTKPTAQELESLTLSAYMLDREAEAIVKRPANQIKQERHRAAKKFRRAERL
jgi:hypothetical protein